MPAPLKLISYFQHVIEQKFLQMMERNKCCKRLVHSVSIRHHLGDDEPSPGDTPISWLQREHRLLVWRAHCWVRLLLSMNYLFANWHTLDRTSRKKISGCDPFYWSQPSFSSICSHIHGVGEPSLTYKAQLEKGSAVATWQEWLLHRPQLRVPGLPSALTYNSHFQDRAKRQSNIHLLEGQLPRWSIF